MNIYKFKRKFNQVATVLHSFVGSLVWISYTDFVIVLNVCLSFLQRLVFVNKNVWLIIIPFLFVAYFFISSVNVNKPLKVLGVNLPLFLVRAASNDNFIIYGMFFQI